MNAAEVREAFFDLPELPLSEDFWTVRRAGLRVNAAREPIEKFLSWPSIVGTMFVAQPEYIQPEWEALMAADRERWAAVTAVEYGGAPHTNLIHQAYHLHLWERATGLGIAQIESIIEVGGGYGALALVCRRAGFNGRYTIYDLPEISLLQQFYLAQMGVAADFGSALEAPQTADLLVAIYSLSETNAATVAHYLDHLSTPHYLVGLKDADWQGERLDKLIDKRFEQGNRYVVPHDPGSYFWIG